MNKKVTFCLSIKKRKFFLIDLLSNYLIPQKSLKIVLFYINNKNFLLT